MIDRLIKDGKAKVDVLETKDTWFGVTYQEDKLLCNSRIQKTHRSQEYIRTAL